MLNLKKVLGAKPKEHVQVQLEEMMTPWGEALDPNHVLEEHPTPQFRRDRYRVLNGTWRCAFVENGHDPAGDLPAVCSRAAQPNDDAFAQEIVVPFSPEAPLSGVRRQLQPSELLWYRRSFEAPALAAGERCILHFQAVDYACACRVNGAFAGAHEGGYLPFAFDITALLHAGENELLLCVADPSEFGGHLRGKQRFDRGDIWYTAQSGIWQTVWLELVPVARVKQAIIEPDLASGTLVAGVQVTGAESASESAAACVNVQVLDAQGTLVAEAEALLEDATAVVTVRVPDVHPWSPDDPYLYGLRIAYGNDVVHSYCAFREVRMRHDAQGHARLYLNGEPLFVRGVLDQAYWSDGLMTAPADDALVFDIQAMRDAGFNLMRKHIKIESERWYYHCDRLGMLVMQDMVQGGDPDIHTWDWSYKPTLFKVSWARFRDDKPKHWAKLGSGDEAYRSEWTVTCRNTVRLLANHPCIVAWSLFNEGWGQFSARAAFDLVRALDPTRPIDAVSGWYDQGCGDFYSVHNYFRELAVWPCKYGRASFVSEFGGFSHRVEGHSSLPDCYGYEVYDDLNEWRRAVRALLAHMDSLEDAGLAGYVYTQVSDIEEETNGLLTYDRRINKLA